jgi:hypothetical protein
MGHSEEYENTRIKTHKRIGDFEKTISNLIKEVVRGEWDGSDPVNDDPLYLSVRVVDRKIQVFCVGKWRNLRYYQGKGRPSKVIMDEVLHRLELNSGYSFRGRTVIWRWK